MSVCVCVCHFPTCSVSESPLTGPIALGPTLGPGDTETPPFA